MIIIDKIGPFSFKKSEFKAVVSTCHFNTMSKWNTAPVSGYFLSYHLYNSCLISSSSIKIKEQHKLLSFTESGKYQHRYQNTPIWYPDMYGTDWVRSLLTSLLPQLCGSTDAEVMHIYITTDDWSIDGIPSNHVLSGAIIGLYDAVVSTDFAE